LVEAVRQTPDIRVNHDTGDTGRESSVIAGSLPVLRVTVGRLPYRTMTQRRTKEIRVNESDLAALKTARDQIDSSLALGAVARLGAQRLMSDESDKSEVSF